LTLTRELGQFKVTTKPFKIQELMKACKEKRVYEAFGAGTAAIVSPVQSFVYENQSYEIPIDKETGAGKLTQKILQMMIDLQYGHVSRPAWQFYL
jgi:branched-chain amino acid aminotransferase